MNTRKNRCVSDFVKYLHKNGKDDLLTGYEHYYDPGDYNVVIYHQRSKDYTQRLMTVLKDGDSLVEKFSVGYDDVEEYQLLARAFSDQAIKEGDTLRLKTKEGGDMNSEILQSPVDPEATFREKAGKEYIGYSANVTEASWGDNSAILDYQYDKNTRSDSDFLEEHLENMEKSFEPITLAADGAYSSQANKDLAESKNVKLVTTNLTGKDAKDIYADFKFSEDRRKILQCPNGHEPLSTGYVEGSGKARATFGKCTCDGCPFKDQCNPKIGKWVSTVYVSFTASARAQTQRYFETEEYKFLSKFRNGVETIPSILRRKYGIDKMPVRGLIRTKHLFGIKVASINVRKLFKYKSSLASCTQNPEMA